MSNLEKRIQDELTRNRINFETQKHIPIDKYPWQTDRSKTAPKCDIFLIDFDLYIEVKGLMTYMAVSKLSYLSRQNFKYYIFQGTKTQWNPTIQSYLTHTNLMGNNGENILNQNIDHQIQELVNLKSNSIFLEKVSSISLFRLKNYIETKIEEYKSWNGEWY